ncbi:MAG: histidine phosphatase family protein [Gammaproteobacteria bacterium]
MLVDLIRHGEPVGGRRYRGQTDDPLSEKGWRQMEQAVERSQPWSAIVTSTLSRCSEFAYSLGTRIGKTVHEEARFKEIGFGEWEGKTPDELQQLGPDMLKRFLHEPVKYPPPGAESLSEFSLRVSSAWEEILVKLRGEHILVVAHAGVMRAIIGYVLNMPVESIYRLQVDNAAISRIKIDDERPATLVFHNTRI